MHPRKLGFLPGFPRYNGVKRIEMQRDHFPPKSGIKKARMAWSNPENCWLHPIISHSISTYNCLEQPCHERYRLLNDVHPKWYAVHNTDQFSDFCGLLALLASSSFLSIIWRFIDPALQNHVVNVTVGCSSEMSSVYLITDEAVPIDHIHSSA